MNIALAVSVIGILLGLYYFFHGKRVKKEELGPVPTVTDDQLWILREMGSQGARREFHPQRPSSGHVGTINSIWFGNSPVDYEESRWVYDLMEKDLKQKGLIDSKGDRYFLLALGERVLRANLRRKIKNPKPIIDARTGYPREEGPAS